MSKSKKGTVAEEQIEVAEAPVELTEMEIRLVDTITDQVKEVATNKIQDLTRLVEERGGKLTVSFKTNMEILGNTAKLTTSIDAKRDPIHAQVTDELIDDTQAEMPDVVEPAEAQGRKGKKKSTPPPDESETGYAE